MLTTTTRRIGFHYYSVHQKHLWTIQFRFDVKCSTFKWNDDDEPICRLRVWLWFKLQTNGFRISRSTQNVLAVGVVEWESFESYNHLFVLLWIDCCFELLSKRNSSFSMQLTFVETFRSMSWRVALTTRTSNCIVFLTHQEMFKSNGLVSSVCIAF